MKFSKKKNYQIEIGPYPFEMYYSPSETAWNSLMKEFGKDFTDTYNIGYPINNGGTCTVFTHPKYPMRCIITFKLGMPENQTVGVIAHEATHAVDYLIEKIGEEYPGKEFRAYTTQWITQNIYSVWKGLK